MSVEDCARIVERGDPDRFRAAMAAPPPTRAILFPLYAFNLEVARAPRVTREPLIAEMRLQWWRDVLADDAARAHEVAEPLRAAIRAGVPADPLDALVEARRRDVAGEPFGSADELRGYLEGTAGNLLWASAAGLGEREALRGPALRAGFAGGLAAYLLALPALRAGGADPVAGLDLKALARSGLAALREARRASFGPGVPAMRAQWWAQGVLDRAARDPDGPLAPSEGAKRARLLWLTLRRAW